MAIELEENIHQIYDWHRVAEVMPLLEKIMVGLEADIDKVMLAIDPIEAEDYGTAATMACLEYRAIDKLRKALTKVIKRGKTASKTIAPKM